MRELKKGRVRRENIGLRCVAPVEPCSIPLPSSPVPSPPTARRLHSQWRSRPRATLHFYRLSRPIKRRAVDLQRSFLHFHDLSRAAYEKQFRASLIALPGSRRESPIGRTSIASADNADRFFFPFRSRRYIHLSFIMQHWKEVGYLNLRYFKVWSRKRKGRDKLN